MSGLLFLNGRIWTGDSRQPWAEALRTDGSRIASIGSNSRYTRLFDPEIEIVDLKGAVVLPGFTDSHVHLTEWAKRESQLDLDGFRSLADVIEHIKANIPDEEWIIGGGWNSNLWKENRPPRADDLNFISPLQKVVFFSKDFHSAWVNEVVIDMIDPLKLARYIDAGQIPVNRLGQVTGVFLEDAMIHCIIPLVDALPSPLYSKPSELFEKFFRHGITGLHTIETFENYRALRDMYQDRAHRGPRLSVYVYHHDRQKVKDYFMKSGDGGPWFRFLGLKYFLDGALGSHTAWMTEPYDTGEGHGIRLWDSNELRKALRGTEESHLKLAVHAIGDAALREALDVLKGRTPYNGIPDRIEHAQLLRPDLLEDLKNSGLGITGNPSHLLSDYPTAEKYWGKRSRWAFAYRTMLDMGLTLAFASDAPVETVDPWPGIHAAVNRIPYYSGIKWTAEECITVEEAVQAMTSAPAALTGESDIKGKLLPGYLADLFVCSNDPFRRGGDELSRIQSDLTVLDGRIVYRSTT